MASRDIEPNVQDLTHLDWSESAVSSATGGSYLKARSNEGAQATYYKLSCYDEINGIYGHECVNELIAARLMDVLCINHVPYRLVHALVCIGNTTHETWLTESASFREKGESKTSLAKFYGWNHLDGESRLDFCTRFGWMQDVQKMMLVDFLIANRDRHGGNIEILRNRQGHLRLAPLFDNGLCFFFSTYDVKSLRAIHAEQDIIANNYLGTRSLEENLMKFVPANLAIERLHATHKSALTDGLAPALDSAVYGISGQDFLDYIWNMLWERWCIYESLRDSRRLQTQS